MTAPVVQGIQKVEARSSVEVNDSCNNCCPCWPRRVKKHHHKKEPSTAKKADEACKSALQIMDPIPKRDVKYQDMPTLPGSK